MMELFRKWLFVACLLAHCVALPVSQAQQPNSVPGNQAVQLNLRGETPLPTLVEYVSQRLGLKFVYDESLAQKKIFLQIKDDIPVENLFDLLQSALQISGYVVTKTENPVWYRIVANDKLSSVAIPTPQGRDLSNLDRALPIMQIFQLKRADPNQIQNFIRPFLTNPGGSVILLPVNRSLIVIDAASNIVRIKNLIDILDADRFTSSIRFVKANHVAVEDLAKQLQELLVARARTDGVATGSASSPETAATPSSSNKVSGVVGLEIAVDARTNQVILVGLPPQIESAMELLKLIDVPLPTTSQTYRPQFLSASQLEAVLREWIDKFSPRPPFESRLEGDAIVIQTTDMVHQQIRSWLPQLDTRETSAKQSPIRFYKIKNIPVQDILETLNSLQGGFGLSPFASGGPAALAGSSSRRNNSNSNRSRTSNDRAIPGQNNPFVVGANTAQPGLLPPTPPAMRNGLADQPNSGMNLGSGANMTGAQQLGFGNPLYGPELNPYAYPVNPLLGAFPAYGPGAYPFERGIQSPLGNAQVTADVGSNTLIIIAEPEVQTAYEKLIEFLDKRRPQVMIEARIVIIDTTDDYTLGVEVSGGDRTGSKKLFAFSSYGLSEVSPTTGALTIRPNTGFNATLVDPTTADVVVRALTTHRRARVLSTPKLLVDDNAEGTLESVNEVPFTSVNASQTVATTSFAGFAKAGTTITVTPTISEAKHVSLDYLVTLNSFTGEGTAGVPPPRQTNEIKSRVTVPDGYTIIVGGLTQKNVTSTINGIPYLEKIPIVRELSSLTVNGHRDNSLFIFLRPIILEEDKFRDLRDLSRRAANSADDGHNFPYSSPLLMK